MVITSLVFKILSNLVERASNLTEDEYLRADEQLENYFYESDPALRWCLLGKIIKVRIEFIRHDTAGIFFSIFYDIISKTGEKYIVSQLFNRRKTSMVRVSYNLINPIRKKSRMVGISSSRIEGEENYGGDWSGYGNPSEGEMRYMEYPLNSSDEEEWREETVDHSDEEEWREQPVNPPDEDEIEEERIDIWSRYKSHFSNEKDEIEVDKYYATYGEILLLLHKLPKEIRNLIINYFFRFKGAKGNVINDEFLKRPFVSDSSNEKFFGTLPNFSIKWSECLNFSMDLYHLLKTSRVPYSIHYKVRIFSRAPHNSEYSSHYEVSF